MFLTVNPTKSKTNNVSVCLALLFDFTNLSVALFQTKAPWKQQNLQTLFTQTGINSAFNVELNSADDLLLWGVLTRAGRCLWDWK